MYFNEFSTRNVLIQRKNRLQKQKQILIYPVRIIYMFSTQSCETVPVIKTFFVYKNNDWEMFPLKLLCIKTNKQSKQVAVRKQIPTKEKLLLLK